MHDPTSFLTVRIEAFQRCLDLIKAEHLGDIDIVTSCDRVIEGEIAGMAYARTLLQQQHERATASVTITPAEIEALLRPEGQQRITGGIAGDPDPASPAPALEAPRPAEPPAPPVGGDEALNDRPDPDGGSGTEASEEMPGARPPVADDEPQAAAEPASPPVAAPAPEPPAMPARERVLLAWRAGHRDHKPLMKAARVNAVGLKQALGELRAEGAIPPQERIEDEPGRVAAAELGKPLTQSSGASSHDGWEPAKSLQRYPA